MRRGHRKLWREVALAAAKVAESKNHAEEYIYGIRFATAMEDLLHTAEPRILTGPATVIARPPTPRNPIPPGYEEHGVTPHRPNGSPEA